MRKVKVLRVIRVAVPADWAGEAKATIGQAMENLGCDFTIEMDHIDVTVPDTPEAKP